MPLQPVDTLIRPFHILSIQGNTGTGKTYTALNGTPGIIGIQSTDGRWRNPVQTLGRQAEVIAADYFSNIDLSADDLFKEGDREASDRAAKQQQERITRELWEPFSKDFKETIARDDVQTLLWDQADEFNEYLRLANFGKMEKNPQMASGPVNMEYKGLVREAIKRKKNLVLIHQMKQSYKQVEGDNGKEKSVAVVDASGRPVLQRRANRSADYLIDSFIQTHYDEGAKQFLIQILHAKKNVGVNGLTVPSCDWVTLMSLLDPMVQPEEWGV